jgi:cytochrome b
VGPPTRHRGKSDRREARAWQNPIGRVVLIVLLAGLLWLVGKGVLTLWRMLSTGL